MDRKISAKNYVYAFLILLGSILIAIYIFSWYRVKQEEKLLTSYLISSKTIESSIKDLDSLEQILGEAPSSYFIYFSYTEDEAVYKYEKELKRVIDKYKLNDSFYYFDVTKMKKENNNYLDEIKNKLKINNLDNIPSIIYVSDGNIKNGKIITGLKIEDFKKLLEDNKFVPVK